MPVGRAPAAVAAGGAQLVDAGGAAVGTEGLAPTGRWVSSNAAWLRVVVVALGAVVLLWGLDTSLSRLVWSAVLVVVLLVLIELAAGLAEGRRKAPPAVPVSAAIP